MAVDESYRQAEPKQALFLSLALGIHYRSWANHTYPTCEDDSSFLFHTNSSWIYSVIQWRWFITLGLLYIYHYHIETKNLFLHKCNKHMITWVKNEKI